MSTTAFNTLANFQTPTPCRILPSSCCLDKDLVVLISRLGSLDRISLWNTTQGTKIWEVEVGEDMDSAYVVDLAWSPDGQSVAVLYDPPTVTIHSIQDGKKMLSLPVENNYLPHMRKQDRASGIWWLENEKITIRETIPDIFKRNGLITGSSLSILKNLPLLDTLPDENDKLSATDIFAFQGSQTRAPRQNQLPDTIRDWPTLVSDPLLASIFPSGHRPQAGENTSDESDANKDSLLVVANYNGCLSLYQDGAFPLGRIHIGDRFYMRSLFAPSPSPSILLAYVTRPSNDSSELTPIHAVHIDIPLIRRRFCRELSQLASAARDLTWYAMRVVREMRSIWFGSETNNGAREWGPRWMRSLETKQKEQYGQEESTAILDLTCLLVTGRASDALADFLGSGEQMTERKWEASMTESLGKLRDYTEKRLAPALQRLHLILEEVQGWSLLPQYRIFELSFDDISSTLDSATRGVTCASWLSVIARKEFTRFREFISWLRFEIANANPSNDAHAIPRHDILEANAYLMSGLVVSSIDKWFIGPVPQFTPRDLGIPTEDTRPINLVLEQIRNVAGDPGRLDWQANGMRKDLSHLDRNLDALVQELAIRCQRIFARAAAAASRSAVVSDEHLSIECDIHQPEHQGRTHATRKIRERISSIQDDEVIQYLATLCSEDKTLLLLARIHFGAEGSILPTHIYVGALQCHLSEDEEHDMVDLLDFDFFDDEHLVVIYRSQSAGSSASIATVNYVDVGYQELELAKYVKGFREDLMDYTWGLWRSGELGSSLYAIERRRIIRNGNSPSFSMAVNGRVGRRVACVLDSSGTAMESFDLEGEVEDMEVADDGRIS
ncbi:hypothetical protein D9756_003780 [Leucocoprinus leucothites]|uniref:Anaphase-promoting complex subunit 4 n=1 Tax=Leucocoprinus leucothites TaxID=201217 RepID=A0A8H5G0C8_9AGAR|nr:hypothetical protein D9756_003780 [Leucoagaricus leucothites]